MAKKYYTIMATALISSEVELKFVDNLENLKVIELNRDHLMLKTKDGFVKVPGYINSFNNLDDAVKEIKNMTKKNMDYAKKVYEDIEKNEKK